MTREKASVFVGFFLLIIVTAYPIGNSLKNLEKAKAELLAQRSVDAELVELEKCFTEAEQQFSQGNFHIAEVVLDDAERRCSESEMSEKLVELRKKVDAELAEEYFAGAKEDFSKGELFNANASLKVAERYKGRSDDNLHLPAKFIALRKKIDSKIAESYLDEAQLAYEQGEFDRLNSLLFSASFYIDRSNPPLRFIELQEAVYRRKIKESSGRAVLSAYAEQPEGVRDAVSELIYCYDRLILLKEKELKTKK